MSQQPTRKNPPFVIINKNNNNNNSPVSEVNSPLKKRSIVRSSRIEIVPPYSTLTRNEPSSETTPGKSPLGGSFKVTKQSDFISNNDESISTRNVVRSSFSPSPFRHQRKSSQQGVLTGSSVSASNSPLSGNSTKFPVFIIPSQGGDNTPPATPTPLGKRYQLNNSNELLQKTPGVSQSPKEYGSPKYGSFALKSSSQRLHQQQGIQSRFDGLNDNLNTDHRNIDISTNISTNTTDNPSRNTNFRFTPLPNSITFTEQRPKQFWSPSPKKDWSYYIPHGLSDYIQGAVSDIEFQIDVRDNWKQGQVTESTVTSKRLSDKGKGIEKSIQRDIHNVEDVENEEEAQSARKRKRLKVPSKNVFKVSRCTKLNRFLWKVYILEPGATDKQKKNNTEEMTDMKELKDIISKQEKVELDQPIILLTTKGNVDATVSQKVGVTSKAVNLPRYHSDDEDDDDNNDIDAFSNEEYTAIESENDSMAERKEIKSGSIIQLSGKPFYEIPDKTKIYAHWNLLSL